MDKKTLSAGIRSYLFAEWDMDLVGFCPAEAMDDEPVGKRPRDILPCAKSIVVYGRRLLDGGVQATFRRLEDGNETARSVYSTYGLELVPNWTMLFTTFYLANHLENTYGATTQPLANGPEQGGMPKNTPLPMFAGPYKGGLPFSVDHAAVAAGLGQLAWSGFVVTREFGPRVQFGCLLTDLELEYDSPDGGERLCDPEKCHVCSEMCPMHALPEKGACMPRTVKIAGRSFECSPHRENACAVAALGMRDEFSGVRRVGNLVPSDDPTDEELAEGMKNYPTSNYNLDHYPKSFCNRCQIYCPLGDRRGHFTDKGMSKF